MPKTKTKGARDRIVETARQLFYTQGYKNTGINQIIEESATSKASFYQYFKSKDELALCYLEYYEGRVVKTLQRLLIQQKKVKTFIHIWSRLLYRDIKYNQQYNGCPFANLAAQMQKDDTGPIVKELGRIVNTQRKALETYFKDAQEDGELGDDKDPIKVARRIFQVYEGALVMTKMANDLAYVEDLEEMFLRQIYY